MAPFHWRDSLSLDVPVIDRDHKHLIGLVNRIHYLRLAGADRRALGNALADLETYTETHFAREEMLMRLSGYPDLAAHAKRHVKMKQQVAEWVARFAGAPERFDVEAFASFVNDWLVMHILGEDMKIKPWVEKLACAA